MRFDIITIFPEMIEAYCNESILRRAQKNKLIKIEAHNLRNFTSDKHKKTDDKPYGGGPGMVMKAEPIVKAVSKIAAKNKIPNTKKRIIFFEPSAKQFDDKLSDKWAKNYKHLIMVPGRYEGIDERAKIILKKQGYKIEEVSVGPYVLTGGELPAMLVIDSISRKIPNVLGNIDSLEEKRHGVGMPSYTRPEIIIHKGKKYPVPPILISGHHKNIDNWRKEGKKTAK